MLNLIPFGVALAAAFLPMLAMAEGATPEGSHGAHGETATPYAGLQDRSIKSLSDADIAELTRGGGWGFALPAELNGYPGPLHVLELAETLALTEEQVTTITAIFDEMRADAIEKGRVFLAAERALSDAFAAGNLTEAGLDALLSDAARARAALRRTHLSSHLALRPILTEAQRRAYAVARGYADDPCARVPEGHDAEMWRRHNGCG